MMYIIFGTASLFFKLNLYIPFMRLNLKNIPKYHQLLSKSNKVQSENIKKIKDNTLRVMEQYLSITQLFNEVFA